MKTIRVLLLLYFSFITTLLQAQPKIPYPIIFIHGLNSSDETWFTALNSIVPAGETIGTYDISLNSDGNDATANLLQDVVPVGWRYPGSIPASSRIYLLNFDNSRFNSNSVYSGSSFHLSNQAAITKQGYALKLMIQKVLEVENVEKVILVGHSMGGLAIREYLQRDNGTNWIEPSVADGHKVAHVVTIGTPHRGSNSNAFGFEGFKGIDVHSEAVRDLRYNSSFITGPFTGYYLFGGNEANLFQPLDDQTLYNKDINCNGQINNDIIGLNEPNDGTYDNHLLKLPTNLKYTWIIGAMLSSGGTTLLDNDGIVLTDRQWLYTQQSQPSPMTISDTLSISGFELIEYHTHETENVKGIIRGLDEPEIKTLAYRISLGDAIRGRITYRSNSIGNPTDVDLYKITTPSNGRLSIKLSPGSAPTTGLALSDDNGNIGSEPGSGEKSINLNSTAPNKTYFIWVNGNANSISYKYEYTLSTSIKYLSSSTISPVSASSIDPITFKINYTSKPSEAPDNVKVYVDGIAYTMSTTSANWANGASYSLTNTFNAGIHNYYFEASANSSVTGLRYPATGTLSFNVSQSVAGWDISATSLNASPTFMLTGQAVIVTATVYNGSNTDDKIYYNVPYKFELFNPSGTLISSPSGTIASLSRSVSTSISTTVNTQNTYGNYTCIFTLLPDKDSNTQNNTLSNILIVGQNGSARQYSITASESFVELSNSITSHTFNGNTYTLTNVATNNISVRQNTGTIQQINKYDFREYNSQTSVLICEVTTSTPSAFISFGYSNTNFVTFDETNVTVYPGGDAIFTGRCSTRTFGNSSPEIYKSPTVDGWYSSLTRFDNNNRIQYKFRIASNATVGAYSFWLASVLSNNDKFLRELTITVAAPPPSITSLNKTLLSADDEITISGTNLGTTGTVKFGNIQSTAILSWNNSSITFVVPSGISQGVVTVTNSNGTSNGLAYSVLSSTGNPTIAQPIPDQILWPNETLVVGDLDDMFSDPNGLPLSFTVNTNNAKISFDQTTFSVDHILKLIGAPDITIGSVVTVSAFDNTNKQVADNFNITVPQKPTVVTLSVSSIGQTQAQSGGNITSDGYDPVIARGVCWSNSNNLPTTSDNTTLDGSGLGSFSSTMTGLTIGTQYYVRSYAVNNVGVGYGTVKIFTTSAPPTLTNFTPTSGAIGTSVTITGTNFSGASAVSFGGTAATSFSVVSGTSITAVVGTGTSGSVSVTTPGGTVTKIGFTFIPAPTISLFTPTSAASGATVTITGTNLIGASAVSFGGTAATSFSVVSATTITAVVGAGTSGSVSVTTPGGTATKTGFTFINAPAISSFTPTNGASGATVTITGINFIGATAVSFGGTAATSFSVVSATSITAVVGTGTSGSVSVTTPSGTATKTGFIFIPAPSISSFSPTSAASAATVTITGTNFTGATIVSFGG
ncbi:MAG: IPT/TIG domain-containing protein, partial [Bacteroidota bacterium]